MTRPSFNARLAIARDELERLHRDHDEAMRIVMGERRALMREATAARAATYLAAREVETRTWRLIREQERRVRTLDASARVERIVWARGEEERVA